MSSVRNLAPPWEVVIPIAFQTSSPDPSSITISPSQRPAQSGYEARQHTRSLLPTTAAPMPSMAAGNLPAQEQATSYVAQYFLIIREQVPSDGAMSLATCLGAKRPRAEAQVAEEDEQLAQLTPGTLLHAQLVRSAPLCSLPVPSSSSNTNSRPQPSDQSPDDEPLLPSEFMSRGGGTTGPTTAISSGAGGRMLATAYGEVVLTWGITTPLAQLCPTGMGFTDFTTLFTDLLLSATTIGTNTSVGVGLAGASSRGFGSSDGAIGAKIAGEMAHYAKSLASANEGPMSTRGPRIEGGGLALRDIEQESSRVLLSALSATYANQSAFNALAPPEGSHHSTVPNSSLLPSVPSVLVEVARDGSEAAGCGGPVSRSSVASTSSNSGSSIRSRMVAAKKALEALRKGRYEGSVPSAKSSTVIGSSNLPAPPPPAERRGSFGEEDANNKGSASSISSHSAAGYKVVLTPDAEAIAYQLSLSAPFAPPPMVRVDICLSTSEGFGQLNFVTFHLPLVVTQPPPKSALPAPLLGLTHQPVSIYPTSAVPSPYTISNYLSHLAELLPHHGQWGSLVPSLAASQAVLCSQLADATKALMGREEELLESFQVLLSEKKKKIRELLDITKEQKVHIANLEHEIRRLSAAAGNGAAGNIKEVIGTKAASPQPHGATQQPMYGHFASSVAAQNTANASLTTSDGEGEEVGGVTVLK